MDLKYYNYDTNGNGKWISLKATTPTTTDNEKIEEIKKNDSAFTTPNYIINNLVKKEGTLVKYYDETILNPTIEIKEADIEEETDSGTNPEGGAGTEEQNPTFISKISVNTATDGSKITINTITHTIETDGEEGENSFVSDIIYNENERKTQIVKSSISESVLNPISCGTTPPGEKTSGFFYLQVESSNNGSSV